MTRVDESPPEAVALTHADSDAPSWPSSRTAGGARSPSWTTSASGMPASWTASEQRNEPGWPRAWLPVVDNLERALEHAGDRPTPVVEGVRSRARPGAAACSSGSAIRAMTRPGCRSTRSVHEVVGVVEPTPDSAPGTVVAGPAARLRRKARRQLRPAAVVVSRRGE